MRRIWISLPGAILCGLTLSSANAQESWLTLPARPDTHGYFARGQEPAGDEAGFNAHLLKPVDLRALVQLLAETAQPPA